VAALLLLHSAQAPEKTEFPSHSPSQTDKLPSLILPEIVRVVDLVWMVVAEYHVLDRVVCSAR